MANLRELREKARSMDPPLEFSKDTTKEQLEELIAERLANDTETVPWDAKDETSIPLPATEKGTHKVDAIATSEPPEAPGDYARSIEINEADLNMEFKDQAKRYLKYAVSEARAQAEVIRVKTALEMTEAEVEKKIRAELEAEAVEGKGKVTEKRIQSAVITHPLYRTAFETYLQAKENADVLKAVVMSFAQRKDMLMQLGMAKRQEMEQNGMNLREKVKDVVGKRTPV